MSLLNPRSDDPNTGKARDFAYGALPLFVTDWTGTILYKITGNDWSAYYGKVYEVGRVLSALFDTLTVLIVYLIGRRVASRSVGLLAAIVAAFTPPLLSVVVRGSCQMAILSPLARAKGPFATVDISLMP